MAMQQGDAEWADAPNEVHMVQPGDTLAETVAELIGLANTHGLPTMSMDDCYPEEMFWVGTGWFATAIMVWREY